MTDNAPPSANPADEGNLTGLLRVAMGKTLQGLDTMLPARVVAYDRATNRATVQPLIMMGTTDGQRVSRAQVASVPVFQYAGGGFVLSFPIAAGDLGWIKASDRDISLFLQSLGEEWPNTVRSRSFSDGVFFPDRLRAFTLDGGDTDRVVLQTDDGTTRVSVGAADVKVTAGDYVLTVGADGIVAEAGDSTVTIAPAGVTIAATLTTVEGPLTVTGLITAEGGITP